MILISGAKALTTIASNSLVLGGHGGVLVDVVHGIPWLLGGALKTLQCLVTVCQVLMVLVGQSGAVLVVLDTLTLTEPLVGVLLVMALGLV